MEVFFLSFFIIFGNSFLEIKSTYSLVFINLSFILYVDLLQAHNYTKLFQFN